MRNWIPLILILLLASSCAMQETKGKEIRVDVTYRIYIEGDGDITFSPASALETLSGNMAQDAASDIQIPVSIDAKIPLPGDPSALLDTANSLITD